MHLLTRIAGTVVGIDSIDPIRWDDSEWRCLEVITFRMSSYVPVTYCYLRIRFLGGMGCPIHDVSSPSKGFSLEH